MRDFNDINRVVVKVGTNMLSPSVAPEGSRIEQLARDIAGLRRRGLTPLVVSSGAIGFGAQALGLSTRPTKIEMRQACAAVGQPILMEHWRRCFDKHGITTAQILLIRETFDGRRSFLNLRNAVENLLAAGTIPIFNENDSISTTEIGDVFGDNDSLSAHIASKLDAGLLVLLSDIDALYDKDPKLHPDAQAVLQVDKITDMIRRSAGKAGSNISTGGMITKLQAVEVAARAGCRTVLADGRIGGILGKILDGEEIGTLFRAGRRISARSRWILGARPKGRILVDAGALAALESRKSLLPRGVIGVEGVFEIGDIVLIESHYQAVSSMGSDEIRRVMGRHSREIAGLLGTGRRSEVIRAEDIIPLK